MAQETPNQDTPAVPAAQATIPPQTAAPTQDNQGVAEETFNIDQEIATVPVIEEEMPKPAPADRIEEGSAKPAQKTPKEPSEETAAKGGATTTAGGNTTVTVDNGLIIHEINDRIVTCSRPLTRFKILDIGDRTTIVTLQSGALVVFSPGPLTDAVTGELNQRGNNVRYLVAMNKRPLLKLAQWRRQYQTAEFMAPEGYEYQGLVQHRLTAAHGGNFRISDEFDADIDIVFVHAHPVREVAFLHKPSHTMIVGRLIFNLPAREQYNTAVGFKKAGRLSTGLSSALGASGRAPGLRMLYLWYTAKGRKLQEFKTSMALIDGWNFDKIIPRHGEVIPTGSGKEAFRRVFKWYLPSQGNDTE